MEDLELRISDFASLAIFTLVENPLQINLFMQNKPNLVRRRRIANSVCTRYYENFLPLAKQKNKPNSNPNKPNLRRAKMNINSIITKDYRKKDDFVVRINEPNSKPISSKAKMNVNVFVTKDYENERLCRPKKTNPNKPNFTYPQRGKTEVRCRMSEVRYLSSVFCSWAPGSLLANQTETVR